MNKKEFEEKIEALDIKKIPCKGFLKCFLERHHEYYTKKNEMNIIYGIQKKDKGFIIFFKDIERGITTDIGQYQTEEEAYDNLLITINS